ncbi:MAG: polysaccharide deacetylase family protein, partial [Victivallaceae bacterium]|nr:polysaccharide deacetylase family protein [Victivallaceae bacterium]
MKFFVRWLLTSVTLLAPAVRSAEPLPPVVCKWKNNAQAAFTLTFDDGLKDQFVHALALLKKYQFRASFYVTGQTLLKLSDTPPPADRMSLEDLQTLRSLGHEIGNHSFHHYQLPRAKTPEDLRLEIDGPRRIFQEKLGFLPETFCYPGCSNNPAIEKLVLVHHLGAMRWRFACGGAEGSTGEYSQKICERALFSGGHTAGMIHAITAGFSRYTGGVKDFESLLRELDLRRERLWVDTCANIMRYEKTRSGASIKLLGTQDYVQRFVLESFFPSPCALTLRLPAKEAFLVQQNDKPVEVIRRNGFALFDVLPGEFKIIRPRPALNPLGLRSTPQTVRLFFADADAAAKAKIELLGLPDGKELAVTCRWDDTWGKHEQTVEAMRRHGIRGSFYMNAPGKPERLRRLLQGGNSLGCHTIDHAWLPNLNANAQFRQFMLNKLLLECASGTPVNSQAIPFTTFSSPEGAVFQQDLGKIMSACGILASPDAISIARRTGRTAATLAEPTLLRPGDRQINREKFDRDLENFLKTPTLHQENPAFCIGIHSMHTPEGLRDLDKLFADLSGNPKWWYCNVNEYGAYRYEYANTPVQTQRRGNQLILTLDRFDPLELGADVPLSIRIKEATPVRVEHGELQKNGILNIPRAKGMTDAVIRMRKSDGVTLGLRNLAPLRW